jgi:hypothetical protein
MIKRLFKFIKNVAMAALNTLKDFVQDIVQNAESTVILITSAVGVTAILTELPFHYALPAIIDAPLAIPVLSTFIVLGLITLMQYRFRSFSGYQV